MPPPGVRGPLGSLALFFLSFSIVVPAHAERPASPFGVTANLTNRDGLTIVRFQFAVPPEHVVYSDRLHFENEEGATLTPVNITAPVVALDKATGKEKKLYHDPFFAEFRAEAALWGNWIVKFQGCSNSACYFPEKRIFRVSSNAVAEIVPTAVAEDGSTSAAADWRTELDRFRVLGRQTGYMGAGQFVSFLDKARSGQGMDADEPFARYQKLGLAATVFFILLGGAGLNLTPCVLPLIPINLAIIGAGKGARTRGQGFLRGATYGAGMALAYGVLGLAVVLTGSKFGALNSSVWFNAIIAVVFVVLALAMFDRINLDFSRFEGHVGDSLRHQKSQALVAFGLGAMAALLAGACVAPVVISVLLLSANLYAKGLVLGLLLPFVLGLGMALPWPLAGASLSFLPKPGPWMKWVKYSFGVLILVFSFFYGRTAVQLFRSRSAVTSVAGAPNGPASGGAPAPDQPLLAGLQQARAQGRTVLIDFQASWCKNCLAMEETVFPRTNVQAHLADFLVIKYQAERPNESPAKEVLDRFGVIGLPTYVVLTPNQQQ